MRSFLSESFSRLRSFLSGSFANNPSAPATGRFRFTPACNCDCKECQTYFAGTCDDWDLPDATDWQCEQVLSSDVYCLSYNDLYLFARGANGGYGGAYQIGAMVLVPAIDGTYIVGGVAWKAESDGYFSATVHCSKSGSVVTRDVTIEQLSWDLDEPPGSPSATTIAGPFALPSWSAGTTIQVCVDADGNWRCTFWALGRECSVDGTGAVSAAIGGIWGYQQGTGSENCVKFYNFRMRQHHNDNSQCPECPEEDCEQYECQDGMWVVCDNGETPATLTVIAHSIAGEVTIYPHVITGGGNAGAVDCNKPETFDVSDLNGSFIVPMVAGTGNIGGYLTFSLGPYVGVYGSFSVSVGVYVWGYCRDGVYYLTAGITYSWSNATRSGLFNDGCPGEQTNTLYSATWSSSTAFACDELDLTSANVDLSA